VLAGAADDEELFCHKPRNVSGARPSFKTGG